MGLGPPLSLQNGASREPPPRKRESKEGPAEKLCSRRRGVQSNPVAFFPVTVAVSITPPSFNLSPRRAPPARSHRPPSRNPQRYLVHLLENILAEARNVDEDDDDDDEAA